jgi:hypothetical protein
VASVSAVLVVPNVKVRMEAQHFILPLSLCDLLHESCTFMSTALRYAFLVQVSSYLWNFYEHVNFSSKQGLSAC